MTATAAPSITPAMLHILRHSIGIDDDGTDRYPNARSEDERRNYFCTGPDGDDARICNELCELGLMQNLGPKKMLGGMHTYSVTDAGREVILMHKPTPKKVTRGRRRYMAFLNADCGMRFGEWLKTALPEYERRGWI